MAMLHYCFFAMASGVDLARPGEANLAGPEGFDGRGTRGRSGDFLAEVTQDEKGRYPLVMTNIAQWPLKKYKNRFS